MVFDRQTYADRLEHAGFTELQAKAIVDVTSKSVVQQTLTKTDLAAFEQRLMAAIHGHCSTSSRAAGQLTRKINSTEDTLTQVDPYGFGALRQEYRAAMDVLALKMTLQCGGVIIVGFSVMAALLWNCR